MDYLQKQTGYFLDQFKTNLRREYNRNSLLKSEIANIKVLVNSNKLNPTIRTARSFKKTIETASARVDAFLSKASKYLFNFGSSSSKFLISEASEDHNHSEIFLKGDKVFTITNRIKDYLGSIKLLKPLSERIKCTIGDYCVLNDIETNITRKLIIDLFQFKNLEGASPEAFESMKRLRAESFNFPALNILANVQDVRNCNVERIYMKNGKKTIKCTFEITVVSEGTSSKSFDKANTPVSNSKKGILDSFIKNSKVSYETSYGCIIEYCRDGDRWIANTFSYSKL